MGDLSICSWLLVPKLIAGEPKNDKSRKLLKQLIELQVVPDCTTSKGSNIGNQNDATTEAAERDVLTAINCGGLQRINVTRSAAGDVEHLSFCNGGQYAQQQHNGQGCCLPEQHGRPVLR